MTADSASDKELKTPQFEDALNCVDFENKFATAKKEEEGASGETSNSSRKTKKIRGFENVDNFIARFASRRLPLRVEASTPIVNESKEKKTSTK